MGRRGRRCFVAVRVVRVDVVRVERMRARVRGVEVKPEGVGIVRGI